MFAKSTIVSLAVVAAAAPALSAPIPAGAGAVVGDLAKSLGKGLLTGGALTGLLSLLDGGSDAPAARDLEARGGLATALEKLIGAGEASLGSVIKKAIIGGAASAVAVEGVNAAAGSKRAAIPASVVSAAEKGIGSVIGNGVAGGIGSALGGLGIGAAISSLFGGDDSAVSKRAFSDLSDDEVNSLLEYIGQVNTAGKRSAGSSITKSLAGTAAGLAATQAIEASFDEIKGLFERETSLDELD